MKRLLTTALSIAILSSGAVFAANPKIDNAEKATKGMTPDQGKLLQARQSIKEALQEDPSIANDAKTYYVAGLVELKLYDNAFNMQALGQQNDDTSADVMGAELIDGYNYLQKALSLDTIVDNKGKTKTKYSKDIKKLIKDHVLDFYRVGENYNQIGKSYPEGYNSFLIFTEMPEDVLEEAKKANPQLVPYAYFNMGLGAYNAQEFDKSANGFKLARLNGFAGPDPYNNEIAAWYGLIRTDESRVDEAKKNIKEVSKAGYEAFGLEQPIFITNLINAMVNDDQIDEAMTQVNQLINENPENPNLYGLRAYIYSVKEMDNEALTDYEKAASLPEAPFDVFRNAAEKFYRVGQAALSDLDFTSPNAASEKQTIKTKYFDKSKAYAQKALEKESGNHEAQSIIDAVDYIIETNF